MAVDSACTNRLPSLKFVGDTLSVSALIGRVTFDLLTLNLVVHIITRRVGNVLPTNFGISGTFVIDLWLWANACQTDHVTLRP